MAALREKNKKSTRIPHLQRPYDAEPDTQQARKRKRFPIASFYPAAENISLHAIIHERSDEGN